MKITPRGYYEYDDFSNMVGLQNGEWPYNNYLKIFIEISKVKLTEAQLSSFINAAKDNQATKAILFGIEERAELNSAIMDIISTSEIEYFSLNDVEHLLESRGVSTSQSSTYKKASDIVAAPLLVDALPDLALQKIPNEIQMAMQAANPSLMVPAWDIFEEAVFASFLYCMGYTTKQLGKQARFKHEPEGFVIVEARNDNRFGFLYECKSAAKEYHMSADDMQTYIDYINSKKPILENVHGSDLRYFVIVGPDFSGDKDNRRNEIHRLTGVLVVYLQANTLKILAQWACKKKDPKIKVLINIGDILSKIDQIEVDDKTVSDYIKKFEEDLDQILVR